MAQEERAGKGGGQRGAPHGGRGRKVSGKRRRHNTPPHREERPKNRPLLLDSAAAAVVFVQRPAPGPAGNRESFSGFGVGVSATVGRVIGQACGFVFLFLRFSVFLLPPVLLSPPLLFVQFSSGLCLLSVAPPISPLPVETFYRLELTAAAPKPLSNPKS
jgi:hypothetical protein